MLTLHDVIKGLRPQFKGLLCGCGDIDIPLNRVVIDSREIQPGDLFVALKGERGDGHAHLHEAIAKGARAALLERQQEDTHCKSAQGCALVIVDNTIAALQAIAGFWRLRHAVQVIGVTGSVGKTTTKELVAWVLEGRFKVLKNPGNLNNEIGLPLTLLQLDDTYERAVLEMGMYALGEIKALAAIAQPRIGVVTNVGPSHLERLGTIERIAQAKAELVESLPSKGVAVLNADDERVRAMKALTTASVVLYGLDAAADVRGDDVASLGLEGIRFTLHWRGEAVPVHSHLLGKHSVHSCLAAAAVGLVDGMTLDEIAERLASFEQPLRLVAVPGVGGSTILDDTYNASPTSTIAALDVLAALEGRKIAVLGDMLELGDVEEAGHRQVGRHAAGIVSLLIVLGERSRLTADEAKQAGLSEVYHVASHAEAIDKLKGILSANDSVLVKGSRGMTMERIVEGLRQ